MCLKIPLRFGQNPSGQKTEKGKTQKFEAAGFGEGQG